MIIAWHFHLLLWYLNYLSRCFFLFQKGESCEKCKIERWKLGSIFEREMENEIIKFTLQLVATFCQLSCFQKWHDFRGKFENYCIFWKIIMFLDFLLLFAGNSDYFQNLAWNWIFLVIICSSRKLAKLTQSFVLSTQGHISQWVHKITYPER